jgi:hypothetical protein
MRIYMPMRCDQLIVYDDKHLASVDFNLAVMNICLNNLLYSKIDVSRNQDRMQMIRNIARMTIWKIRLTLIRKEDSRP